MWNILHSIGEALLLAAAMGWEVLRCLILGFTFLATVNVLVSKAELQRLLRRRVDAIREQAEKGLAGKMEGHAALSS